MTREEIIEFCEMKSQAEPENEDVFNHIIKVLQQEPCCNCIEFKRYAKEIGFEIEQEPCGDCWSKKEVVDIINRQRFGIQKISMGIIKEKLEALPTVTPAQKWILTSERQPKENGNYLAFYRTSDGTASLEYMMVDHCNAGGGWLHEENGRKTYKKVIAWMPLPEPFSEVEE